MWEEVGEQERTGGAQENPHEGEASTVSCPGLWAQVWPEEDTEGSLQVSK